MEVIKCIPDKAVGIIDANVKIEFLPPKEYERIQHQKILEESAKQALKKSQKVEHKKEENKFLQITQDERDPRKNKLDFTVNS